MRKASVKIVEPQKVENIQSVPVSEDEKMALLAKYYPEQFKKQYVDTKNNVKHDQSNDPYLNYNKPNTDNRRHDSDNKMQKTNQEYYDIVYNSVDIDDDNSVNFKIEIRSNMKF